MLEGSGVACMLQGACCLLLGMTWRNSGEKWECSYEEFEVKDGLRSGNVLEMLKYG